MTFNTVRCRLTGVAAGAGLTVVLAGCGGGNQIDAGNTAKYIDRVVAAQTGFHPKDTNCPSGVPASIGHQFRCHFTGPEGPYTVYLLIQKVHGTRVDYKLKSQPSTFPAPKLTGG